LRADYVTVVEDRPIMSVKYCLPVWVSYSILIQRLQCCHHNIIVSEAWKLLENCVSQDNSVRGTITR